MSEKQLNIKKIQEKICSVINESIATCVLELIKDSYRAGLSQAEFDNNMSLIEENQDLKKQLKIKHDGFMASVEESCDLAKENEKLKKQNQKYKKAICGIKEVCNSISTTHTICGIDKIHDIEIILKEVKND